MIYDELFENKEYIKYIENKVSNEEIIKEYNLDSKKILLLNNYVSSKLKIANFNFFNLQIEIQKLKDENEFINYDRYLFTNFEILKIFFDTLQDINLSKICFITDDFNKLQDISLLILGLLQKYSETHREHIKKIFVKNNNQIDKDDILDNSIYYIKEYLSKNEIESSIYKKIKNKILEEQILFNDDFRDLIFQKLESLEIDYVNNDLKRFTFLEYIVLLPLNLLKIKKDKSKLDELIDSVKLYNDNSNTNPEKQLLYNDLKIIKILAENQILAYCTSLVSKVFNLEYKEIREIYLSFLFISLFYRLF